MAIDLLRVRGGSITCIVFHPKHVKPDVSPAAIRILDDLFGRGWRWFVDAVHPETGLVLDRSPNGGKRQAKTVGSSVASTGFYLSILPEAVRRDLLTADEAEKRARLSIEFTEQHVDHVEGVLAHFVDWGTGEQHGHCEFSALDTSMFLLGCMVAASAYPRLAAACDRLIDRVDWTKLWVQADGAEAPLLSYGFHGTTRQPLRGSANVRSSEHLMPCVLAAGSRTHPVTPQCWYNMRIVRASRTEPIDGWTPDPELRAVLNPTHPLFTSYYGLAWINVAGLHDADGIDLWSNARVAALLNRAYCCQVAAKRFKTYADEQGGWWGLSAGDGPKGYVARGPTGGGDPDGTVWPTAALGSTAWVAGELSDDLVRWSSSPAWAKALGPFGLSPFSLDENWFGPDLLGIDLGATLAMWANARANTIHSLWSRHWLAQRGIEALQFSHP
jgi:hypothetical protein